jgi:signal transduction histidine kinase
MRFKLAFTVLIALLVNIVGLIFYYNLFISTRLSNHLDERQVALDRDLQKISKEVSTYPDYRDYLSQLSKKMGYNMELQTLDGKLVFETKVPQEASIFIRSTGIVHLYEDTYMLKVTKSLSIQNASEIPLVRSLLKVEIGILFCILLMVTILLYLQYVKPIEELQKSIRDYNMGKMPEPIRRMDEIGKLQNSFVQLANNLNEERQKQSRIIASISHDIKTPLTSVMGYAERLKSRKLSEDRKKRYIDTIYEKADVIKTLIGEFDDYLSFNIHSDFNKRELSVGKLCQLIKEDYMDDMESTGVQFYMVNQCMSVSILADLSKIRRVFSNIIGNSMKHFGDTEDPTISVKCSQINNNILFQISDNGMGVPKDILSHIFEPFFTSDDSRKVAGLGLSICKEIIESHEGRIWAENNTLSGVSIFLEIPIS